MPSDPPREQAPQPHGANVKKKYGTPILRALGSVAELTAGGGTVIHPDGKSGMAML